MMENRALIVGGGIAGMAAAMTLRRGGFLVDLVDLDPEWRVYGAGITITGPTLRAFRMLGIYDAIEADGYTGEGISICSVDGTRQRVVPTTMSREPEARSSGGIMRPVLHRILSTRTRDAGVDVTLGTTVESLEARGDEVAVRFTDGRAATYDLVVGADGIHSRMRRLLFPNSPEPKYTGQCAWRIVVPRPASIDRRHFFLGGPVKVGLSPVSSSEMYMFLLEKRDTPVRVPEDRLHVELAKLLDGYGAELADVRRGLDIAARIVVRPLEGFMLPPPWTSGRCVLIGDAAHPTTPQLASGAGMAVEDALVLGAELERASILEALERFMARRYERCRIVVEGSLEIGRLEQERAPVARQTAVLERALGLLEQPF